MMLGKQDSYIKENEIKTLPNTIHNNKLKIDKKKKGLNIKPEAIKLLEENIDETFDDISQKRFAMTHLLE